MNNPNPNPVDVNKDSVERMTMELRILKKRLYTYQFKGLQLQERARNHMLAQQADCEMIEDIDRDGVVNNQALRLFNERDKDIKARAFGSSRNPLSNEYILEMVATHLPVQDLRRCRQVCKLWSEEFSRCYLKRRAIIIALKDDLDEAEEILRQKAEGNCVNVSSLVALDMPVESKIVQDIVTAFGSTLNSLTVDDCHVTAQELYSILRQTPYLETLHMKTSITFTRMRGDASVSIMDHLTSDSFAPELQLPFLKKLVWEDSSPIRSFERLPIAFPILASLKIISLGDCEPSRFVGLNWDSLKTLYLRAQENWKASQFQSLMHLNLKLKSLSLRKLKPGGKPAMEKLHQFISSQSETLVDATMGEENNLNLSIHSGSMNVLSESRIGLSCEMKKLKSVRIDFGFWNSLDIVDKLPALETLDLRSRLWRSWWDMLKKDRLPSPHSNMKQLTLGAIDNECLRKISICFPAITFLEVSGDRVGDWALRTICSSMPQLSCLKISKPYRASTCSTMTDSGFTGMSPAECRRVEKSKFFDAVRVRQFPFIGDLKELRVFEIESQLCCKISDVAVFCGIATLPNLRILTLPRSNISEKGWKKVRSANDAFKKFPGLKKYFPISTGSLDSPTFILTDLFTDE